MTKYTPQPIDTKHITLPDALGDLTEKLAKSTHDQWALQRLSDGWTHGEKRDDDRKTHPSLVPYEDLSNDEQQYDRITALETLKAVLALGFKIHKQEK